MACHLTRGIRNAAGSVVEHSYSNTFAGNPLRMADEVVPDGLGLTKRDRPINPCLYYGSLQQLQFDQAEMGC
ncbi:MAG: hypothetical protein QOF53_17 [Nocardioidaceae bacterium]|jgi:hypothetical protein|nr:hypothetical protein [Nocardioidaceae bacterium]